MSELRKANTDYPYFITLTVVGWIDIFSRRIYAEELIKNLIFCRQNKGLKIYAYVIRYSHVHLVCSQMEGRLNHVIRDFKSFTAKEILKIVLANKQESRRSWLLHLFKYHAKFYRQNKEYRFWQKTSYPVILDEAHIFDQKVEYVHNNPVEAGIVREPENYVFSSANPDSLIRVDES